MQIPHVAGLDEFLRWEQQQDRRYEFVGGEISFLPGVLPRHDIIQTNIKDALRQALRAASVYGPEMRLLMHDSSRYPDVLVTLDARDTLDLSSFRYPTLIVEVLSDSTSGVDRGEKLDEYRAIDTLQEYALVDSRKRWAQTFRRSGNDWIVSLPMTGGTLSFESVAVTMTFEDVYAGSQL